MQLPLNLLLDQLRTKQIYLFKENVPSGFVPKHMHICIKKTDDEILYFVCCTTKRETILRFIDRRELAYSTIVAIPKDAANALDADESYINCNTVIECNIDDFFKSYSSGDIEPIGEIDDHHRALIVQGIVDSDIVENNIKSAIQSL